MAKKKLTERGLGQAQLNTLIEYYLSDMQRRGCTRDSVATNRRTLNRFSRWLEKTHQASKLAGATEDEVEEYVTALQNKKTRWKNDPFKPAKPGSLSPFTVRKEVRILKGFGTWLDKEGFDNPFDGLVVPKEPKRLVNILTEEESEQIIGPINPQTASGSRLYASVPFLLVSEPRIGDITTALLPDHDLETRQIRIIGKENKERIVPFGARTGKALLNYLHVHRPVPMPTEVDQLFLSMDGLPLTRHAPQHQRAQRPAAAHTASPSHHDHSARNDEATHPRTRTESAVVDPALFAAPQAESDSPRSTQGSESLCEVSPSSSGRIGSSGTVTCA